MSTVANNISSFNNVYSSSSNDTSDHDNLNHELSTRSNEVTDNTQETEESNLLRNCVKSVLTNYINDLNGYAVDDLYQLVLTEVEAPLFETILEHTKGNQSKAAKMLGINRGTLRKKLKQYQLCE